MFTGSHTWSDFGSVSAVVSGFRSSVGFGTDSGFVAGLWRSGEGLGRHFEAGGITGTRTDDGRMVDVC